MQLGKFGQKMAVAKYPASHGNASHIETLNGVFCFKTSKWNWPCKYFLNLRHTMNRCLHDSKTDRYINNLRRLIHLIREVRLKCNYAFFLMCCDYDTSYMVSVHIQCQAFIYTLSLCRGHSLRMQLAKQETLTPPGHLLVNICESHDTQNIPSFGLLF